MAVHKGRPNHSAQLESPECSNGQSLPFWTLVENNGHWSIILVFTDKNLVAGLGKSVVSANEANSLNRLSISW